MFYHIQLQGGDLDSEKKLKAELKGKVRSTLPAASFLPVIVTACPILFYR